MSSKAGPTVRTIAITQSPHTLARLVKRIRQGKEYLILESDGVPVAGVMDIDEFEDYLELNDPKVKRDIEKSTKEFREGKSRPARELLAELEAAERKKNRRRAKV